MKRIAKFEKVSYEQFRQDFIKCFEYYPMNYSEEDIKEIYDNIIVPTRATSGSAGYDFKIPMDLTMDRTNEYVVPTGIRVKMDDGWVLKLYPRSGLGFKSGMRLLNTVGIIDSDYYNSDNEGHIMVKISYEIGNSSLILKKGYAFIQGVFVEYGVTEDDIVDKNRNGGFGSTDKE